MSTMLTLVSSPNNLRNNDLERVLEEKHATVAFLKHLKSSTNDLNDR